MIGNAETGKWLWDFSDLSDCGQEFNQWSNTNQLTICTNYSSAACNEKHLRFITWNKNKKKNLNEEKKGERDEFRKRGWRNELLNL